MQDRSLNGVHLKVRSGLLTVADIVENYVDLPGVLLTYINENKHRASRESFARVLAVLRAVAEVPRPHQHPDGRDVLAKYGAIEFLLKFADFLQTHKMADVAADCQLVVRALVQPKAEELASADIREKVQELLAGTRR